MKKIYQFVRSVWMSLAITAKTYFRFYKRLFGFYALVSALLSLATATMLNFWAGDGLWLVLVLLGTAAGFFGSMESAYPSLAISKKLLPASIVKLGRLVGTSLILLVTGLIVFTIHMDIWDSFWLPAFIFWMMSFQAVHLGIARWGKDKLEDKATTRAQVALYVLLFIELASFGIGSLDVASQLFAKTRPLFPMPKVPVPALLALLPPAFFAVVGLLQVVGKVTHSADSHVEEGAAKGKAASAEPRWERIPGIDVMWTLPGSERETAWALESPPDYKFLGEFGVGTVLDGQIVRGIEIWLFSKAEVRTYKSILTTRANGQSFEATGEYEQVLLVGENDSGQLTLQNVGITFSIHDPVPGTDGSIESLKIQITGWQKAT